MKQKKEVSYWFNMLFYAIMKYLVLNLFLINNKLYLVLKKSLLHIKLTDHVLILD